jgi:hypothetical protein
MGREDVDRKEIDRLVSELTAKPGVASTHAGVRPVSRWSIGRLTMPSERRESLAIRLESWLEAVEARLPPMPDLKRYFKMPSEVTMVRLWVALGTLHCASMTFWPYPKTYLWGMVLYLLSLSLVFVTGIWGARLSWDARLGAAHTVALGTVVWALTLATESLPPV